MEMGQNIPYKKVDELPANEFLNLEGRQFSKSEGWTIDLVDFFKHFTADQIRYTLAANAPENQDSEFTWKDFQTRCNSELLGKYGNLANRVLVFIQNKAGGKVPSKKDADLAFIKQLDELVKETAEAYSNFSLRRASQLMMQIAQTGNVYFDEKKPWALAKAPETLSQMESTLYCCLECLKRLALVSSPIIPEAAQKLWEMLGYTTTLSKENWDKVIEEEIPKGRALPQPQVLFKRVENELIEAEEKKLKELIK